MKRRGFLHSLLALVVAPFAPKPTRMTSGTYTWRYRHVPAADIELSTFPLWQSDQAADLTHLKREMRAIYDSCT